MRELVLAALLGVGCSPKTPAAEPGAPVAASEAPAEAPEAPAEDPSSKPVFTDLGEIVLEGDYERPFPRELRYGDGGGLGIDTYYNRAFYSEVKRCATDVKHVAETWAEEHKLPLLNQELSESRLIIHFKSVSPPGFFEVVHRIYAERNATHTYFGFYDERFRRLDPNVIAELQARLALSDFVGNLKRAAECKNGGSL